MPKATKQVRKNSSEKGLPMPEVSDSSINPDWSPLQQMQVLIPAVLQPPALQYHLQGLMLSLQKLMLEDQYDVDGRNSIASSPDAIVISDSSDAENADDGYGSDD
jgi:hypothetical protein